MNARDAGEWMRLARLGDFEGAWAAADRILARPAPGPAWQRPRHEQRVWNGTPLDGRRVLVRCYHGLGDTIQFVRYLPLLEKRAREVAVWAQEDLLPVLRTLSGRATWLPLHDGAPDAAWDADVEVMELPHAFRTTMPTIPAAVPYLSVDAAPLPGGNVVRVGIVWRAGTWDPRRSLPFESLAPLFDLSGVRWYRLQHDVRPEEQHPKLHVLDNTTVWDTAAFMRALDLVVSVDTMPAHLAGALGVPVWTVLSRTPDWRWMEQRADTPWYPTMRLFRQPASGGWGPVIDDLRNALVEWAGRGVPDCRMATRECGSI